MNPDSKPVTEGKTESVKQEITSIKMASENWKEERYDEPVFPDKRSAFITGFVNGYAASQFKEAKPEPDFDGPLAMVDHYQKLSRYWENEAAKWENKFKEVKEPEPTAEKPDFPKWSRSKEGLECRDMATLTSEEFLYNRLFWAFDAGRNCVWSQYIAFKKENQELKEQLRQLNEDLPYCQNAIEGRKSCIQYCEHCKKYYKPLIEVSEATLPEKAEQTKYTGFTFQDLSEAFVAGRSKTSWEQFKKDHGIQ